jgi:hypothetical protein
MILKAHLQTAPTCDLGEEIWQQSLADAIKTEAETIADYAALRQSPDQARRDALQDRIVRDMTRAGKRRRPLHSAGRGSVLADRRASGRSADRQR